MCSKLNRHSDEHCKRCSLEDPIMVIDHFPKCDSLLRQHATKVQRLSIFSAMRLHVASNEEEVESGI